MTGWGARFEIRQFEARAGALTSVLCPQHPPDLASGGVMPPHLLQGPRRTRTLLDPLQVVGLGGFPRRPAPLGSDSEKSSNSLQELADEPRLRTLSTEELRFRERVAASPRPLTAAGARVWRDQEMDGPSPLPPLPSRFRCCCLGSGKETPACAPKQYGEGRRCAPGDHSQGR